MRDPNLVGSSIAVNVTTSGFYVSWVVASSWVRAAAAIHGIQALQGTCDMYMCGDGAAS